MAPIWMCGDSRGKQPSLGPSPDTRGRGGVGQGRAALLHMWGREQSGCNPDVQRVGEEEYLDWDQDWGGTLSGYREMGRKQLCPYPDMGREEGRAG